MYVWEKEPIKQGIVRSLPALEDAGTDGLQEPEPATATYVEEKTVVPEELQNDVSETLTLEEMTLAEAMFREISEINAVEAPETETMEVSDVTVVERMVEGRHEDS